MADTCWNWYHAEADHFPGLASDKLLLATYSVTACRPPTADFDAKCQQKLFNNGVDASSDRELVAEAVRGFLTTFPTLNWFSD